MSIKCRMCDMAEVVLEQKEKAKQSMKAFYDSRSAKEKSLRGDVTIFCGV